MPDSELVIDARLQTIRVLKNIDFGNASRRCKFEYGDKLPDVYDSTPNRPSLYCAHRAFNTIQMLRSGVVQMKTMQFERAEGVRANSAIAINVGGAGVRLLSLKARRRVRGICTARAMKQRPADVGWSGCSLIRGLFSLLLAVLALLQTGCQPAENEEALDVVQPPRVSDVPLRILILGEVPEPGLIKRQWLADSDQPIEIEAAPGELELARIEQCDVVVFPAMLIGDLVAAEAIYELPALDSLGMDGESTSMAPSGGRLAQVKYGDSVFATPLGCSLTLVLGNASLKAALGDEDAAHTWDEVLANIEAGDEADFSEVDLDGVALVDRFLAIVAALTERTATYGVLFEMQTMQPRLTQFEFVRAAEILKSLAKQPGGAKAVGGSHSQAWQWASQGERPRVGISIVNQIDATARETVEGEIISIESATSAKGWNTGHGMVASVSTNCRQSAQATAFLNWLSSSNTRTSMANSMKGVDAPGGLGATDGLAWRATQLLPELLSNDVPHEPSLPGALNYRDCLADGLTRMLTDDIDPQVVLGEVQKQWQKVTEEQAIGQRTQYEKSLGLGF